MSAGRIVKAFALALSATFVEQMLLPKIGMGFLLEPGGAPFGSGLVEPPLPLTASFLPCGYGLVILVVTFTYLWVLMVGMGVGAARSKCSALAEKDGEKEVAERYLLPNLYARESKLPNRTRILVGE
jgi:hypothetical protein